MKLNYRIIGTGQPVIVLHGLFGSLTNWNSIAKSLADHYQMVMVDLRNHGESPHSDEMSYAAMVADVAELIKEQINQPCHLLGHSMGGKTAMGLAMSEADWVKSLIVVDIAPITYPNHFSGFIEAMQNIDLTRISNRQQADAALADAISEPGVRGFLLQNLRLMDGLWQWRINLNAIQTALSHLSDFSYDAFDPYPGETVFIRGMRSTYISDPPPAEINQYFPKAQVVGIENAGHWVHAEQPKAIIKLISEFLNKL